MRFPNRIFVSIAGVALGVAAHPAVSQEAPHAVVACSVVASEQLDGQLIAICHERGIVLGHADSYQVIQNRRLDATIVDLIWAGRRRVLMISFPDGEPLLEDLSGTLAKAAGRGPMSSLDGVAVSFDSFAEDGKVQAASSEDPGKSGELNLGLEIAAEEARNGI